MRYLSAPLFLAAALGLVACATLPRAPIVGGRAVLATIPGFAGVRAVQGYPSPAFQESFTEGLRRRVESRGENRAGHPAYEILVLGAGGPNGAFGAGLLAGWTESGQRPTFDIVTGVSAGALLAPFAFVGPAADATLEQVFRELEPSDIYRSKLPIAGLLGESLTDPSPLQALVARHVDAALLDAVARGHEDGRRLYVGTTDFDVGQLVVWDMGAIAAHRSGAGLELFRRVLLASASVPIFYPPVLFEVRGERGEMGDEMHVDGSVASPLFLPQQVFDAWQAAEDAGGVVPAGSRTTLTVIHNGSLTAVIGAVERDTLDIASRSFSMASTSMAQEAVRHLYLLSRVWGAEFRFACIPDGGEVSVLEFSAADASRLYDLGRERGHAAAWEDAPPGFLVSEELRGIQPVGRPRE